jgi:hypothetical protein
MIGGEEVAVAAGDVASSSSAASQAAGSRSARTRRTRSTWRRSPSGSIRWRAGGRGRLVAEAVDADDHLLAGSIAALDAVRGLLDLALLEAALDGGERAAHSVDLVEVGPGRRLELVRQRLDVPAARRAGRASR